jgi:hypothetical protein
MQEREFDFNLLIGAMGELALRSLATLIPVLLALVGSSFAHARARLRVLPVAAQRQRGIGPHFRMTA